MPMTGPLKNKAMDDQNENDKKINVLLVEDDALNVELIKAMLSSNADFACSMETADCLAAATTSLQKKDFDIILLDLGLPDGQELDAISRVYNENPKTPIVAVTALDDELMKDKFIGHGLEDYLIKGTFDSRVLISTILQSIEHRKQTLKGSTRADLDARIAQLEESETRYRVVFENSAVAIMVTDAKERIVSWNKAAEKLLDMNIAGLYLKPVSSLYPETEWKRIRSLKIREIGAPRQFETVMLKNDGSLLDAEISISILKDASGKITGSIGVISDISERKRAEGILKDKARRSEILFKLLKRLTPDLSSDHMLNFIVVASKSLVKADTASITLLRAGQSTPKIVVSESSGFKVDGSILQPSLDRQTSITGWVIKNRKPLLLHGDMKNDERFKNIKWKEGIKCSINAPIFFKGSVKGTINLNIISSDYLFTEDDLEAIVALANHAAISLEHSGLYKSMKDKYIEVLDSSNESLKKTNQKLQETQDQLVQTEKMSAIGQLASGVAHEINNPLSGVLGNVQIIRMEMKSGGKLDDLDEILTVIEESAKRCKSITQNLLDFSRQKEGVFDAFDIHKALNSAVMLVGYNFKNAGIQIDKKYTDDLPPAYGNANEIQQVFLNMFSNAKWAIDKKGNGNGTIAIETRAIDNAFIEVNFTDTGIGISHKDIKKIFEAFYTTKEVGVGTGLGLSLCYEIMQRNKGDLSVDSEEGKGATFHIKVPVAQKS